MHELSIATSLIELASEHARDAGAERIQAITLRIGTLSCVHQDALQFSFELVSKDTMLEGATLHIVQVPVTIFCAACEKEVQLAGIQSFRCPSCDTPSGDIRKGRELEIESIEIVDSDNVCAV
tara:strand:- start:66130 stop:66498 length:369 start_codon:yes stop_codon:yes gene_type:complete